MKIVTCILVGKKYGIFNNASVLKRMTFNELIQNILFKATWTWLHGYRLLRQQERKPSAATS